MAEFRRGDKVQWQAHGVGVASTVKRRTTADTTAAGRTVRASAHQPQFVVVGDKTDAEAVHTPSALTAVSS